MNDKTNTERLRAALADIWPAYHDQNRMHFGPWADCDLPFCADARRALAATPVQSTVNADQNGGSPLGRSSDEDWD